MYWKVNSALNCVLLAKGKNLWGSGRPIGICHIDGVRVRMAIGLPEGSEHLPSEHGRALFCKICASFGLPHSCRLTSLWTTYV